MIYHDLSSNPKVISNHYLFLKKELLDNRIAKSTLNKGLKDFISKNLNEIITGKPKELEKVNRRFIHHPRFKNSKIIVGKIRKIFDYKYFVRKKESKYDAYTLASNLNLRTCLYCNRLFTITVNEGKKEGKIIRPQFDHFYNQKENPLLALSIYNLIPSCNICNGLLKRDVNFKLFSHVHPYQDNYLSKYYYDFIPFNVQSVLGRKEDLTVKIVIKTMDLKEMRKIHKSCEQFQLERIMTGHSNEIMDLLDIRYRFSKRYFKELFKTYKNLNLSYAEVYRIVFGTELNEIDYHARPFSKLKKDLLEQLNII